MDGLVVLFGLGLVAAVIGVPIAAFVALSRTGRFQRALTELERQVQRLRSDAQALQLRLDAAPERARGRPLRLGPRPCSTAPARARCDAGGGRGRTNARSPATANPAGSRGRGRSADPGARSHAAVASAIHSSSCDR